MHGNKLISQQQCQDKLGIPVKNKPKSTAKKWAKAESKSKKPGILKKRNMASTLTKLTIQDRNPQVEMDSEITRLREEIEQEQQMK